MPPKTAYTYKGYEIKTHYMGFKVYKPTGGHMDTEIYPSIKKAKEEIDRYIVREEYNKAQEGK